MYLSYLKPFHKESFLDLSLMIANADHEFNVLEKDLIEKLCEEMGIHAKASTDKSINDILENLATTTTTKEKKIILLELLGIVMVDQQVKPEEIEVVNLLINKFTLSKNLLDEASNLLKKIYSVYSECGNFINE